MSAARRRVTTAARRRVTTAGPRRAAITKDLPRRRVESTARGAPSTALPRPAIAVRRRAIAVPRLRPPRKEGRGRVADLSATRWTLVQAAQAGDAKAIEALCGKYRPAILAWLERRGLKGDAEDVAQEALLGLVASALQGAKAEAGSFRGLVFAVARNKLLKHLEKQGARKRGAGKVQALGELDPASPAVEDDDFDREWLSNLVKRGLARLSEEHPSTYDVLKRFVVDEKPQAEIAKELGLPVDNVKKLVYRGKRKVAGYLRDEVWSYALSKKDYDAEIAYLSKLLGEDVTAP